MRGGAGREGALIDVRSALQYVRLGRRFGVLPGAPAATRSKGGWEEGQNCFVAITAARETLTLTGGAERFRNAEDQDTPWPRGGFHSGNGLLIIWMLI